jgi:N-acetylmuramoyl-L-alanine amidase
MAAVLCSCGKDHRYRGGAALDDRPWLYGKKIFIDPGHGGRSSSDLFRVSRNGQAEGEINLRVAMFLSDMLKRSGAYVSLSRKGDSDTPLDERLRIAEAFSPDLLVSIHHNGSQHSCDGVNYPSILFWGSVKTSPASYDLARLLKSEFERLTGRSAVIASDMIFFSETGTRMLSKTSGICPGIIGEAGFFSDEKHSIELSDKVYLEREAEAYYEAISLYLKRGIPSAELHFSCGIETRGIMPNLLSDCRPSMVIRFYSGNDDRCIDPSSLRISLDGVPVSFKKILSDVYQVDYGKELYPGIHRLRFVFRNTRSQSSMVSQAHFSVPAKKGDRACLIGRGRAGLHHSPRNSLLMLLSAYSLGGTDPGDERLVGDIAKGFLMIGDKNSADFYRNKLRLYYTTNKRENFSAVELSERLIVDFHGKKIQCFASSVPSENKGRKSSKIAKNPAVTTGIFGIFKTIFNRH